MSGAKLYELLAVEVDLRELRLAAVARPLEMAQIEQGMKNKVVSIEVWHFCRFHRSRCFTVNLVANLWI